MHVERRINWGIFKPAAIIGGLIGTVSLGLYEFIQSDVQSDVAHAATSENPEAREQHQLVDGGTILYVSETDSSKNSYVFNFDMGYVLVRSINLIDSRYVEHTGSFVLTDFEDAAMIDRVRLGGCAAARQAADELADYSSGSLIFRDRPESAVRKEAEAQRFLNNHCPGTPAP